MRSLILDFRSRIEKQACVEAGRLKDVLVISANTVRSHIKSIYSKLNVHHRDDALERAKELGLL